MHPIIHFYYWQDSKLRGWTLQKTNFHYNNRRSSSKLLSHEKYLNCCCFGLLCCVFMMNEMWVDQENFPTFCVESSAYIWKIFEMSCKSFSKAKFNFLNDLRMSLCISFLFAHFIFSPFHLCFSVFLWVKYTIVKSQPRLKFHNELKSSELISFKSIFLIVFEWKIETF